MIIFRRLCCPYYTRQASGRNKKHSKTTCTCRKKKGRPCGAPNCIRKSCKQKELPCKKKSSLKCTETDCSVGSRKNVHSPKSSHASNKSTTFGHKNEAPIAAYTYSKYKAPFAKTAEVTTSSEGDDTSVRSVSLTSTTTPPREKRTPVVCKTDRRKNSRRSRRISPPSTISQTSLITPDMIGSNATSCSPTSIETSATAESIAAESVAVQTNPQTDEKNVGENTTSNSDPKKSLKSSRPRSM